MLDICCGYDDREPIGYNLCQFSAIRRTTKPLRFVPLMEKCLRFNGLYRRPHEKRDGQCWDVISDAPMSTAFANSRFLTPWVAGGSDWILFADFSDMLFLADPAELFNCADERYAVMVVKGRHEPDETTKMDDQQQTVYPRKNWSSVILWNLRHKANRRLTLTDVNQRPGRDLHRFFWLRDGEIGELPHEWNFLVGIDPIGVENLSDPKPRLLHYTLGSPELGYNGPWSKEWLSELAIMDATRPNIRASAA